MAVSHKSVISFGLVAIPIAIYMAIQNNDIQAVFINKTIKLQNMELFENILSLY
jgi:non-homologous end joining protein Ku